MYKRDHACINDNEKLSKTMLVFLGSHLGKAALINLCYATLAQFANRLIIQRDSFIVEQN